jgi:peptidyl-prolyl cis-trans isomerase C
MKRLFFALAPLPFLMLAPCLALAQLPTKEPARAPAKPAAAAPASGPLATVNGVAIPRSRLEAVIKQQVARGAKDSEQLRAQVREALINNELLVQEASRSGIAKRAEVQQQLELNRAELIANAQIGEYLRAHPVNDAEIQKEYERARQLTGEREYRARHILVASEDDAKTIIADLKKGAKFEEVAQKRSLDEGSRPKGGDLDWNVPNNFDKAFSDAMVKLEKGRMTDAPVRSRFGFHVIQLDDVRAVTFPKLDQVRQQIQQRIVQARVENLVRDLRAKAKIE